MSAISGGKPYILKYPIAFKSGTTTITEVIVRRPRGKDIREFDRFSGQPIGLTLAMIDRLCRMPDGSDVFAGFADELDAEDIEALGELVSPGD